MASDLTASHPAPVTGWPVGAIRTRRWSRLPALVLAVLLPGITWSGAASASEGQHAAVQHSDAQHAEGAEQGPQSVVRSAPPAGARVYFIDLKDGARVPLKVLVRIGLANMGVAPAGIQVSTGARQVIPSTGHHHIIVDAPLPRADRPIPADDNHIHLGGGQTEAELTLTPGPHTLQLLVGDANHVPNDPPVASPRITVVAMEPRKAAPPGASVSFIGLRDGANFPGPVRLYFGVQGMGVAPADSTVPNTGYFHVAIDADTPDPDRPLPRDDRHVSFPDGATQTDLTLAPGTHTVQLVFTDPQGHGFDPPLLSRRITIKVRRDR